MPCGRRDTSFSIDVSSSTMRTVVTSSAPADRLPRDRYPRGGIGNDSFVRYVSELPDELRRDVEVLLIPSHLRRTTSVNATQLVPIIQGTAERGAGSAGKARG